MGALQDTTLFLYNITLFPIIFFSVLFLLLCVLNLVMDRPAPRRGRALKSHPFVSVQIPVFNDPVAARCVEHCLAFDYPKDRYELVIADDSTDAGTQALMRGYAQRHPGRVKYIHRDNRAGYKPGALKHAMPATAGEIIVIFDADWTPKPDFLRRVLPHFDDPRVAIVQTRQGFLNHRTNLITRFAAYILMVYHTILMPINHRVNTVFFCGTAGAIRRKAIEDAGHWNLASITEDTDMSVKILAKGYTSVYIDVESKSEVPDTFEGFLKQQMRWCYGITRVFFDNFQEIFFRGKLTWRQRLMISFITLGNVTAPLVVLMTMFGYSGWFLGEPALMNFHDVVEFFARFLLTAGFLVMGAIAMAKRKMLREYPYLVVTSLSLGLILAVANTYAFTKAVCNSKLSWFCTPKVGNDEFAGG